MALFYGSGDFFGGLAAKRSPESAVVIGSFFVSALCLIVVTVGWAVVGDLPVPAGRDIVIGVAAGLVGPVALGLLYRGLSTGRMSVVAPITAVVAAVVPFLWGIAQGERPSIAALVGVGVALLAVGLISGAPAHHGNAAPGAGTPSKPAAGLVPTALGSGLGFGIIFVLFGSTSDHAGLWPLFTARPVSVAVAVGVLAVWSRRRDGGLRSVVIPDAGTWWTVAAAGVLDLTANALYLAGTQRGLLSIVAVLSSLYPAATVLLARLVLGERLHRIQVSGLVLAIAGAVAMAGG